MIERNESLFSEGFNHAEDGEEDASSNSQQQHQQRREWHQQRRLREQQERETASQQEQQHELEMQHSQQQLASDTAATTVSGGCTSLGIQLEEEKKSATSWSRHPPPQLKLNLLDTTNLQNYNNNNKQRVSPSAVPVAAAAAAVRRTTAPRSSSGSSLSPPLFRFSPTTQTAPQHHDQQHHHHAEAEDLRSFLGGASMSGTTTGTTPTGLLATTATRSVAGTATSSASCAPGMTLCATTSTASAGGGGGGADSLPTSMPTFGSNMTMMTNYSAEDLFSTGNAGSGAGNGGSGAAAVGAAADDDFDGLIASPLFGVGGLGFDDNDEPQEEEDEFSDDDYDLDVLDDVDGEASHRNHRKKKRGGRNRKRGRQETCLSPTLQQRRRVRLVLPPPPPIGSGDFTRHDFIGPLLPVVGAAMVEPTPCVVVASDQSSLPAEITSGGSCWSVDNCAVRCELCSLCGGRKKQEDACAIETFTHSQSSPTTASTTATTATKTAGGHTGSVTTGGVTPPSSPLASLAGTGAAADAKVMDVETKLFAVFDGHGGCEAADFAAGTIACHLRAAPSFETDLPQALVDALVHTDHSLLSSGGFGRCGSTACLLAMRSQQVILANLGDSRGILFARNGELLLETHDHKPCTDKEAARLTDIGANIKGDRIDGELNVSRGLGDFEYKNGQTLHHHHISSIAEVYVCNGPDNAAFGLLATDGVWDVISPHEAIRFILDRLGQEYEPHSCTKSTSSQPPRAPSGATAAAMGAHVHVVDGGCSSSAAAADTPPPMWTPRDPLAKAVRALMDFVVHERNSGDNVTAVLVAIGGQQQMHQ